SPGRWPRRRRGSLPGSSDESGAAKNASRTSRGTSGSHRSALLLEDGLGGVLDLLARLLDRTGGLVGAALGLEVGVVGGPARALLGLALPLLGLVLHLVIEAHGTLPFTNGHHRGAPNRRAPTIAQRRTPQAG